MKIFSTLVAITNSPGSDLRSFGAGILYSGRRGQDSVWVRSEQDSIRGTRDSRFFGCHRFHRPERLFFAAGTSFPKTRNFGTRLFRNETKFCLFAIFYETSHLQLNVEKNRLRAWWSACICKHHEVGGSDLGSIHKRKNTSKSVHIDFLILFWSTTLAYAHTGFADPCFVLDGFVRLPLFTDWAVVLDISWERRESNLGLLGKKRERYLLLCCPHVDPHWLSQPS